LDFRHDLSGIPDVLEHGIALHTLKDTGRKWQLLGIRRDVNARHSAQVEIDIALHYAARAADVKIPPAEGKVFRLGWVHDERRRRL
jgi:hypothetical protein